jgi:hypothetical protein
LIPFLQTPLPSLVSLILYPTVLAWQNSGSVKPNCATELDYRTKNCSIANRLLFKSESTNFNGHTLMAAQQTHCLKRFSLFRPPHQHPLPSPLQPQRMSWPHVLFRKHAAGPGPVPFFTTLCPRSLLFFQSQCLSEIVTANSATQALDSVPATLTSHQASLVFCIKSLEPHLKKKENSRT